MKKYFPAIVFLVILLGGLFTFNQYGESWDDKSLQKYTAKSINAYTTWKQEGEVNLIREDLAFYGPFYVMFADIISKYFATLLPFTITDLRHLVYFLTYFIGIWAFYKIAKHWLSQIPAIGATLLFATQPVLWGHAFINPKDTPFLAFFLLSIALGIEAFDKLQPTQPTELDSHPNRLSPVLTTLWLLSVFSLFIFTEAIHTYIQSLVISAQAGNTNLLSLIAKDINAASTEIYTQRYFILFLQLRTYYSLLITLILLIVWYRYTPQLPNILLTIFLPALFLGFTTSTRILGPYAGVLVAYYAFRTKSRSAVPALAIYGVIALISTYISWPYLWMNPIPRFFESLREMSLYPWSGTTTFNGESYSSTNIPSLYLPVLLAIQLTEPVWALALAGWTVSVLRREKNRELLEISILWFIVPLILFIALHIALYDNFRQIIFILPPIFLMGGVTFEKIRSIKWQAALITVCLIPNIIGIVSLHPYEYIYYNQFVGGIKGAEGQFDLDYWAISYREAAEYVNSVASPNANIWVEGPSHLFALFARDDLKIFSPGEVERADSYEYVVAMSRYNFDEKSYPNAQIVHQIVRDDAVLTVIKKP